MTAVRGTFADFKTVKTRGVCQLIIEVPIENADHALAVLGGVPQAKAEQWVGIAPVTAPGAVDGDDVPAEAEPLKGGRRAKMAGILCGDLQFHSYLNDRFPEQWADVYGRIGIAENVAAVIIRSWCRIDSRAQLDDPNNSQPGIIWDRIESDYRASQRGDTEDARLAQRADGPS